MKKLLLAAIAACCLMAVSQEAQAGWGWGGFGWGGAGINIHVGPGNVGVRAHFPHGSVWTGSSGRGFQINTPYAHFGAHGQGNKRYYDTYSPQKRYSSYNTPRKSRRR
ncbi:MAG: hypothetical protein GX589_05695 [Deltaproteobacteria bacterium]|nr:hypothetical protein [Deltaproteobacteria bacterium]